ncbi:MAG: hypothetical protein COA62_07390 [Rhodobiaceae bacterium]|nr:MAG: hypothetical protein COA62_07390 [Rhodobiaceae bacterium]
MNKLSNGTKGWHFHALFAIFLCAGFSLSMTPAQAGYRYCNATSYTLDSAIGYESEAGWQSQGWFRLLPGSCDTVLQEGIDHESYFVFARSIDAHSGGTKYFSGSDRFCTAPGDFHVNGRTNCASRGFDNFDFTRVETRTGNDWTTTFSEPADYSLKRAEVAGVQRLLRDIDAGVSQIDGLSGNRTTSAITAFQRSINLRANGQITPALFAALTERAEQRQATTGLSVCNTTDYLVWAAVAYESGEGFTSSGWIRIEPARCEKAIKGELIHRYYYTYAEAVDGAGLVARRHGQDLVWAGNHTFCTKGTRFEIEGRATCSERGFDETGFKRVDTNEALVWTETLK